MARLPPAIDKRDIDTSLARNPVHIPVVDLPEDLGDIDVKVTRRLIAGIQETCNDSPPRRALYYAMIGNERGRPFDTKQMDRMVTFAVHWSACLITTQNYREDDAIRSVIDKTLVFYAALECEMSMGTPDALDVELTDAQMDGVERAARDYDKTTRLLEQFMRNWDDDINGRSRDRGRDRGRERDYDRRERDVDRYDDRSGRSRSGRERDREETRGGRGYIATAGATRRDGRPTAPATEAPTTTVAGFIAGRGGRATTPAPEAAPPQPVTTAQPARKPEMIPFTRKAGEFEDMIGSYSLAPLFIRGRHLVSYQRNTGETNWTVAIIPRDSVTQEIDMQYSAHATDRFLLTRTAEVRDAAPRHARANKAFEDLAAAKRVEELLGVVAETTPEHPLGEKLNNIVVDITEPQIGLLTSDFLAMATSYLESVGLHDTVDVEESQISFILAISPGWVLTLPASVRIARDIAQSRTWSELRERFLTLRDIIPMMHWEGLHTEVIKHVNEICMMGLGLDLWLTSFVDDIQDLTKAIIDNGNSMITALWETKALREICETTLCAGNNELLSLYEKTEQPETLACFYNVHEVILLPVTSGDLDLGSVTDIAFIPPNTMTVLHEALEKRFLMRKTAIRNIRIVTQDNATILCRRSLLLPMHVVANKDIFDPVA